MDAKSKRNAAESIRRALSVAVADLGFVRSKTTFWVRPREHVAEFFHLHLFTFKPSFRVHLGIRVMNDDCAAVALNGRSSFDGWYGWEGQGPHLRRELVFDFDGSSDSTTRCVRDLERFVREVGEPWFTEYQDLGRLADDPGSPLRERERDFLRQAMAGTGLEAHVQSSKRLLGVE